METLLSLFPSLAMRITTLYGRHQRIRTWNPFRRLGFNSNLRESSCCPINCTSCFELDLCTSVFYLYRPVKILSV